MNKTFALNIITPVGVILSCDTTIATMLSQVGEFGVLAGHASLIANLMSGVVKISSNNKDLRYFIDGGIAHVTETELRLITQFAANLSDINAASVRSKINESQNLLSKTDDKYHINIINNNIKRYEAMLAICE